jgi:acetylornithine deacetylase/succinyl-diaminopimelate desuccinylase-like protein
MNRRLAAIVFLAFLVSPLCCRKAASSEKDAVETEAQEALTQYLRIDTQNPPGNETAGAKFLQQLLVKNGIDAKLVGDDPNRQGVYARLSSGTSEKALVLLHHIDVVPVVPAEWTKPAFGGLHEAGYIWGRGALDIKSLGIAELMAVLDLKRRNARLARDVIYLAVPDEELGGLNGAKALLDKHPELFANVGYVLNEGGYNETIVDHVAFWGVEVQQKVPLFLRLTMRGAPGHAASPPDDGGVLARLVDALGKIRAIETPYRLTPAVERFFHAVGAAKKDEKGEVLRAIREPLDLPRIQRVLPMGYRSLLHDTIAITRINGGGCTNCLPAVGTADLDIRLLPDETGDAMEAKVRELLGKQGEVQVLLKGEPSPESPANTDLYRVVSAAFQKSDPGSGVAPVVQAGTSDSRFFRARGVVAYGIAPFKVNYYDAETVHGTDERIRERFFDAGVRLMREIVRGFCEKGKA